MDEVPFFFRGDGDHDLFAVLHRPPSSVDRLVPFVFCHPLAEEKLWSHRVFVAYARRLAAAGHPVLRFDLSGHGDSEGQFSELSVEQASMDLIRAIGEVRRLTGAIDVSLLGLRFGATLARIVAERLSGIRHLVLWAPITDGERYMQDLLRINLMTQMAVYKAIRTDRAALAAEMEGGHTVNVDGYELGRSLFVSVSSLKPDASPSAFVGPSLVVQIDRQARPARDLDQLAGCLHGATATFAQEEMFWKEISRFYQQAPNLFAVTTPWIAAH